MVCHKLGRGHTWDTQCKVSPRTCGLNQSLQAARVTRTKQHNWERGMITTFFSSLRRRCAYQARFSYPVFSEGWDESWRGPCKTHSLLSRPPAHLHLHAFQGAGAIQDSLILGSYSHPAKEMRNLAKLVPAGKHRISKQKQ